MRRSWSATKSASTRPKKCFARLWSVEKFDADASYHPMIVLSNLFRRAIQYMILNLHRWIYCILDMAGRLKADFRVILWTVHHVKIKSLPYAVTKQRSCILAVCPTGRQLMAISWHAKISAEKMTACFR